MAYLPLSTANLPDPAINPAQGKSPEDYFDIDTYTGTSATHERSELQFQPDFVWIKGRSDAYSSRIFDAVRGVDKVLVSDSTQAEFDGGGTTYMSSFDSDGFTLTSNISVNGTSKTYVAWNWKANGSGVSNTDGSITSTVSANTESGFSIVSYTGTGSNATVGHGLDSAPDMFIVKNRDRSADWYIYHTDLGATKNLKFTTASAATQAGVFNNTEPTSTVFSLGTNSALNASGEDIIAYCFHSVEGFSKFSSYVGNGSSDGVFVYTGFRPAFLLYKRTGGASSWALIDSERGISNPIGPYVFPDTSDAEASATILDFTSNGFKIRATFNSTNASGETYIYMAFAENPFKFSLAR